MTRTVALSSLNANGVGWTQPMAGNVLRPLLTWPMLRANTHRHAQFERLRAEFLDARREYEAFVLKDASSAECQRLKARLAALRAALRAWRNEE